MKILYFDCNSGISGDMTLGALTDLGVPENYLVDELAKLAELGVDGFSVEFTKTVKNGITANSANVIIKEHQGHDHSHDHSHDHGHDHGHGEHDHSHGCDHDNHEHEHDHAHQHDHHDHGRSHACIVKIIKESGISDNAKKISLDIFKMIAEAEAKVHGTTPEDVHFHEVGALDSIVDIVGAAICIDYLKPDKIISSIVNDGFGFIFCQHGKIPVPVPAVMEIFKAGQVKMRQIDIESELVTPTGAGIVAALSEGYGRPENLVIKKIGYGAGKKDLDIPNVLRVCICEEEDEGKKETITVIEASIDDQTPESLGFAMERLLGAGANDVFFTPIQMKKNRPAVLMTVLCENNIREKICSLIFQNTSTIGMRFREESRICLPREFKTVETEFGEIDIKISRFGHMEKIAPEYECAKKIALEKDISIDEIYRSVYTKLHSNDIAD